MADCRENDINQDHVSESCADIEAEKDTSGVKEDAAEKEQRGTYSANSNLSGIIPENRLFRDVLGDNIFLVMDAVQLNILGQTFRPMFTGRVVKVTNGYITLDPVIIKMNNAPFFRFPTPLSFPLENITYFTRFDPETRISIP